MILPKRKSPRLKDYDYKQNGVYFITICTKNKKCLLCKIAVGGDAHIAPNHSNNKKSLPYEKAVGGDAHIATNHSNNKKSLPYEKAVGDDAHIAPPKINLYKQGIIAQKYIDKIVGMKKYVIMPNHIHMIIEVSTFNEIDGQNTSPPTAGIPQLIKSFKILCTKESGESIWQRSYYDRIIRNENEYKKIYEYINNNPLQWELDCHYQQ